MNGYQIEPADDFSNTIERLIDTATVLISAEFPDIPSAKTARPYWIRLKPKRQLKSSATYRRRMKIVVSLISSYEILASFKD